MRRLAALAAVAFVALSGSAMGSTPERAATDLSTEIMSPFCPGVTLHECPSAEALRLRDEIESWFRTGLTRDEALDRLEAEYGSGIRALPPASGFGLSAWLVAAVAVLGAVALGAVLVRRWSRRVRTAASATTLTAPERARVEDELAQLRAQP